MKNKGQISIFVSLIIIAMMFLVCIALKIVNRYMSKSEASIAANSAVSMVKSKYNNYIFDKYHILLFDRTNNSKGEASLEEDIAEDIKFNLKGGLSLENVSITDFSMLADSNCHELKKQIDEYMLYAGVDNISEKILDKTGNEEANVDESVINKMDEDVDGNSSGENMSAETSGESSGESEGETTAPNIKVKEDDPRKFTKKAKKQGILKLVTPDDLEVSVEKIDTSDLISKKYIGFLKDDEDVNCKFNSYHKLKKDLKKNSPWNNSLVDCGAGLTYANECFNCATNTDKNEDTVLDFEMEYLIAGKTSDKANLKSVVNKMLMIRFVVDYTYILTDVKKMGRVEAIATPLSLLTLIPEVAMKYLIAGCWSYIEAIADVRNLLHGKKLAFTKNSTNWITDIDNIVESIKGEVKEDENGMEYSDYLVILMAPKMNKVYYRMLDVMQLNACKHDEPIDMDNAACGISFDTQINYKDEEFYISVSGGY